MEQIQKPKLPPVKIINALNKIRGGVNKVKTNMVPPPIALLEMITGAWITQCISVMAKFGVADHIGESGATAEEIAPKVKGDADAIYRIMRALTTAGIFHEDEGRRFKLTSVGKCLRTDHPQSMRYMAIFQGDLNWSNWGALSHCVKTGKNAFEQVWGEKPFEHLVKHPEKAEVFDRAMVNISKMEVDSVLAVYDFTGIETLADVGGGYGTFLGEILRTHPQLKGMLFDLPHVADSANTKKNLAAMKVADRIRISTGSFFDSVPAGADAYVMKHIIHDWSDEECIKIMKNIRDKIPTSGKLLLVENVVPERNVPHFSKMLDVEMLVVTTGRERTAEEYAELLAKAGFKLERIVATISPASIIEARPASAGPETSTKLRDL